jgi:two-component system phosphate regulon sensor histidine kinase PhoR
LWFTRFAEKEIAGAQKVMDQEKGSLGLRTWALIAASVGMVAGAAILYGFGPDARWIALASGVGAAILIVFVARRYEPQSDKGPAAATDPMLAGVTPLSREVLEHLPDPLMLLDASGRVLFANKPMRAVVGIGVERKHVSSILRTPTVLEAIQHTTTTGEPSAVECTFHVPVERHYQAYTSRAGQAPSVTTLLLHDLTAVKRSEQMRVDFVANASHELRTPLAAVSGFIDTLKGHARDDAEAREKFLDIMAVEAGRMRRLIEDLLSLSRIELNEHVPPSGAVSIEAVVREAAAALAPLARPDRVTIDINAAPNLPPVAGERDELIQLFQNLLHNAIKYGKPEGHVWVTLSLAPPTGGRGAEGMVAVAVRDDGEGIPSDAVPRLTERFYRVDVKRSREKGGTGLGLAIVKHIVNRHQGRLQIESRAGEGSTFSVSLPIAADTRQPSAAATSLVTAK